MKKSKPVVVVMGSDTDLPNLEPTLQILAQFGVASDVRVLSAHRTPEEVRRFATGAAKSGYKVIIAAAGGAAHLAGVIASLTTLPVIGVPIQNGTLSGFDSLLSTVQMPAGVPVATVAVGGGGAANAAILAVEILALGDAALTDKLLEYRRRQVEKVLEKDRKVRQQSGTQ